MHLKNLDAAERRTVLQGMQGQKVLLFTPGSSERKAWGLAKTTCDPKGEVLEISIERLILSHSARLDSRVQIDTDWRHYKIPPNRWGDIIHDSHDKECPYQLAVDRLPI